MNRLAAACVKFVLLSLLVPASFLRAHGGDDGQALAERARMFLDYQSFMRGDRDGSVRFALAASSELRDGPLAELAVRLAHFYDPATLSAVDTGETEARRVLGEGTDISAELRDSLRRFIARSLAAAGRRDEARDLHRRRGLAMAWLIAGPFTDRKSASFHSTRLPESGSLLDVDVIANPPGAAVFREWEKRPPWRSLPENRSFPFVRPWLWSGRRGDGAMLMFTALDASAADGNAFFHIYSESSWRLFVDGALVAEMDANNVESPVEHMVPFSLNAGRHEVVMQLFPPRAGIRVDNARVALRLESASPFAWSAPAGPPRMNSGPSARREARRMKYLTDLRSAAVDGNPFVAGALAIACMEQGMVDEASWWAEAAARVDPANANLRFLAGMISSMNPLLPEGRRRDAATAWYKAALSARPDCVPALVYLARMEIGSGHAREAAGYLERAYATNPGSLDVLAARGEWANRFASGSAARAAWDECARTFPNSSAAQVALASLPQEGFLDMERRLSACRAAVEAGPYVAEASLRLARALADYGEQQEAEYVLRAALELFAGDAETLERIAGIYSRMSRHGEAVDIMSGAVRLQPDKHDLWRKLGDCHMDAGDRDAALKAWRVSLAANPGQFRLADMLAFLEGGAAGFRDADAYDAIAMTASADAGNHSGDAVRLLDRSALMFQADGSYRRLSHEIDLARNRRGGESLAGLETSGELLEARIVFPNGNTLEPEPYPDGAGLRLPVILPGASREIRYVESVSASAAEGPPPVKPWYFQDPQGRRALLVSEFVVRSPRGAPLVFVVRRFGRQVNYETETDGDFDVHRWTASLGQPVYEPDAAHVSERIPSVEVGLKTTWEEIVHNELRKLEGRLIPSMRMRALVATLSQGNAESRPEPEQLARNIYRYVCDNIDPAPAGRMAAHIHAERMGDRTLLLLSLLRAAGFDAHPAAARPSALHMHPPTWELPRRDIFPVPMVRLTLPGGKVHWLDARFDSLPFGKITDDLSGATLLAFLPGGPLFEPLPDLPAEDSIVNREISLSLPRPGERMAVSGRVLRRGISGLVREAELAELDADGRKKSALRDLHEVFPDAVLERFDVLRTGDDEAASLERYDITASHPVEDRPGGARAVSLCMNSPKIISDGTRNVVRRVTPCHIAAVHIAEDRNAFTLPEGGKFVKLPEPVQIPSNFGVYQLRVTNRTDSSVEVIRNYHIPAQRIPPWEWNEFLDFLRRIDLAEKQWIEYSCTGPR